ncbi:hypothetical protein HOE22_03170 [Candidatus Woesearchaeota archaeon]|jgi:hypothetical protein|nr:hypothetical protein [Candidatus Woesearchaeota archaeon]MBT4730727.1 hypothetical protein [Candidatus Woesearchaeota archaeon]MBT7558721.1 hypothetical protein [Candidatus Woesearchaeota archaeon]
MNTVVLKRPILDMGLLLEFVNAGNKVVGDKKRFELDDEFFDMIVTELQYMDELEKLLPVPFQLAQS